MIPPWILEVGSAFNLIFKNYSTLEVPNVTASDSVSYIIPNASAREKDYFNNNVDPDYMEFDQHELSSIKNIMDNDKPAPWDT